MRLRPPRDISLANKCLLLFGGAIVLIVFAAMIGPWLRMNELVRERQMELLRRDVDIWQRLDAQAEARGEQPDPGPLGVEYQGITVRWIPAESFGSLADDLDWLPSLVKSLEDDDSPRDEFLDSFAQEDSRVFRYVRVVRVAGPLAVTPQAPASDTEDPGEDPESEDAAGNTDEAPAKPAIAGLLVAQERTDQAGVLRTVNTVYLVSAGLIVLALALIVFYVVTHKLVLGPVRQLRETAEQVREGDLTLRSEISTGDEYEELAQAFNAMLARLQESSDQQRSANRALDLKLSELAEANMALYEANRIKAEFLASVSHELRTPLNSIIGFAELLLEIATQEAGEPGASPKLQKRMRYLEHIVTAGQHLMALIEGLLEMAKIEAGKIQVKVETIDVGELCDVLATMVTPQAARKDVEVRVDVQPGLPDIETDPKRLQQVLYNFLSNAVKFIEDDSQEKCVTLRAERVIAASPSEADRLRLSVIDTGPGIPEDELGRVFEKFHRLDQTHAPDRGGAGLGLAISRELSRVLQGELEVSSVVGSGSTFGLVVPLTMDPDLGQELDLENSFRGALVADSSEEQKQLDQPPTTAAG